MIEIKFPWMRAQLLDFLKGLSDYFYQKENWQVFREGVKEYDELDYTIHFLYDDTDPAGDPSSTVGYDLYDDNEVQAIRSIVSAIEVVSPCEPQEALPALSGGEADRAQAWRA